MKYCIICGTDVNSVLYCPPCKTNSDARGRSEAFRDNTEAGGFQEAYSGQYDPTTGERFESADQASLARSKREFEERAKRIEEAHKDDPRTLGRKCACGRTLSDYQVSCACLGDNREGALKSRDEIEFDVHNEFMQRHGVKIKDDELDRRVDERLRRQEEQAQKRRAEYQERLAREQKDLLQQHYQQQQQQPQQPELERHPLVTAICVECGELNLNYHIMCSCRASLPSDTVILVCSLCGVRIPVGTKFVPVGSSSPSSIRGGYMICPCCKETMKPRRCRPCPPLPERAGQSTPKPKTKKPIAPITASICAGVIGGGILIGSYVGGGNPVTSDANDSGRSSTDRPRVEDRQPREDDRRTNDADGEEPGDEATRDPGPSTPGPNADNPFPDHPMILSFRVEQDTHLYSPIDIHYVMIRNDTEYPIQTREFWYVDSNGESWTTRHEGIPPQIPPGGSAEVRLANRYGDNIPSIVELYIRTYNRYEPNERYGGVDEMMVRHPAGLAFDR